MAPPQLLCVHVDVYGVSHVCLFVCVCVCVCGVVCCVV